MSLISKDQESLRAVNRYDSLRIPLGTDSGLNSGKDVMAILRTHSDAVYK